jgi:cobalt-zinc-cadmium efflux system protein
VLLEAAPRGMDVDAVGRAIAAHPGVSDVHDLHVWTITSGFVALSAHVVVQEGHDCHERQREIAAMLRNRFGIAHTTLQTDHVRDPGFVPIREVGRG